MVGSVPVHEHLRKFALWVENNGENSPIVIYRGGLIGRQIHCYLTGKTAIRSSKGSEQYDSELHYELTERDWSNLRIFWDPQSVQQFNKFLHDLMHEMLFQRMRLMPNVNERDHILQFMEDIDIDEDVISFEALKKANYRLRSKKEWSYKE